MIQSSARKRRRGKGAGRRKGGGFSYFSGIFFGAVLTIFLCGFEIALLNRAVFDDISFGAVQYPHQIINLTASLNAFCASANSLGKQRLRNRD